MKKIVKLTESDLVRIVKRVIREQGPYAPGMGPSTKSTTPPGVNPTNKSSLKYTGEFKDYATDELNKQEFERFIDSQASAHFGNLLDFVPISHKIARVNAHEYVYVGGRVPMNIPKEKIPKDINTNPCYSNLKLDDEGGIYQLDVKMSCKKEYQNLAYMQ